MKTILVADDDENIVAGLTHRLQANGYRVITASDGVDALRLALTQKPDLMLLDIWMPTGFGLSIAQRMEKLGWDIPIIFLTASRLPKLRRAAENVGGAAYIEKPYDPEVLLRAIQEILDLNPKTSAIIA
ncbi:MAG TPA: response regulator [Verrucomicrobiae bacterium]|jgi:CheY-like chemotaxis protein